MRKNTAGRVPKPTTIKECVDDVGFVSRRVAIWKMNEYTIRTDEQHDIVRLIDPKTGEKMWYVYNRVYHPNPKMMM